MKDLLEDTKNPKNWISQGSFKIKTTDTVPFCNGVIEVPMCQAVHGEFRILLAQLEVLGIPYLDALEKQGIFIEHKEEIRKLLLENIPPKKRNPGERPAREETEPS